MLAGIDYGPPTVAHFILSSAASTTYDVDFYANLLCVDAADRLQRGRGARRHDPGHDERLGLATIDFPLPSPLVPGQGVTALATDPAGNTSEFSQTILLKTAPRSGPARRAAEA